MGPLIHTISSLSHLLTSHSSGLLYHSCSYSALAAHGFVYCLYCQSWQKVNNKMNATSVSYTQSTTTKGITSTIVFEKLLGYVFSMWYDTNSWTWHTVSLKSPKYGSLQVQ